MLAGIWLGLMIVSVLGGAYTGHLSAVVQSVTASAKFAVQVGLMLTGLLAFWVGIMRIGQEAGLIEKLSRLLRPILRLLFPDIPPDHPAMGAMLMNMTANMLGLTNAATPFGLQAMDELNKLNPFPGVATNAMCTFLAINTSLEFGQKSPLLRSNFLT